MPLMGTVTPENLSSTGKKKIGREAVFQEGKINLPSLLLNPRETSWVKINADEGIQVFIF
jgi:hypothetical protein